MTQRPDSGRDSSSEPGTPPPGAYPPPPGAYPPGYDPYGRARHQPANLALAGWWTRAAGLILDGIIVGLLSGLIALTTGISANYATFVLSEGIWFLYTFALITTRGQTLGMHVMHIRCLDAHTGSDDIGPAKAATRSIVAALFGVLYLIGTLADMLWPIWDGRNQTLHDKAAATVVVRTG